MEKESAICTDYLSRSKIITEGDTMLDVGDDIGYYVLQESRIVVNRGKIYAFEPVKNNFHLLNRNRV